MLMRLNDANEEDQLATGTQHIQYMTLRPLPARREGYNILRGNALLSRVDRKSHS
jgi:hypothetical protein